MQHNLIKGAQEICNGQVFFYNVGQVNIWSQWPTYSMWYTVFTRCTHTPNLIRRYSLEENLWVVTTIGHLRRQGTDTDLLIVQLFFCRFLLLFFVIYYFSYAIFSKASINYDKRQFCIYFELFAILKIYFLLYNYFSTQRLVSKVFFLTYSQ